MVHGGVRSVRGEPLACSEAVSAKQDEVSNTDNPELYELRNLVAVETGMGFRGRQ